MTSLLDRLGSVWSALGGPRERRVLLLLFCVLVLSAGDLYMTLMHLTGPGMLEGNPLARGIMGYNSPAALAIWKTVTVGLGLGILFFARRTICGEIGAWICCLILTWLTIHWVNYNNDVAELTPYLNTLASGGDARWMHMDSGY
jgi:Domain of unknown function (DUF5658)